MAEIDIHRIRELLPHRYPFLLIDRVLSCEPLVSLTAIKNVTVNEPFFQGHFPHRPIFPGVLILESMAQAAALLASESVGGEANPNTIYLFAGIDRARFRRPVEPGDQLHIDVQMRRRKRNIWLCSGTAKVGDDVCCSADLLFTYRVI